MRLSEKWRLVAPLLGLPRPGRSRTPGADPRGRGGGLQLAHVAGAAGQPRRGEAKARPPAGTSEAPRPPGGPPPGGYPCHSGGGGGGTTPMQNQ